MKNLTLLEFIRKAKIVHGNKYDYRETEYINSKTHVIIYCKAHGSFRQTPSNHLRFGCDQCARAKSTEQYRRNQSNFIALANAKHNFKYTYEKTKYKQSHQKITITCPLHGDFDQRANSHLGGRGCPRCKQNEFHPRFGKPSPSAGYFGTYKDFVFRSLSELFWFISKNEKPLPLDQIERRSEWQVPVIRDDGRPSWYCADFLDEKTVVDIKPKWRVTKEWSRLSQGIKEYEKRGFTFQVIDPSSVKIDWEWLKKAVDEGKVKLFPAARRKLDKRRSRRVRI